MTPTVAILAPGVMGAAVAARLVGRGVPVVTVLDGRSTQSADRARAAGMKAVDEAELANVDVLLSILPPAEAMAVAERLAPILATARRKPVYVDCNAVSPETVARIAAVVEESGSPFVDASIIGMPPREGYDGPTFFASGAEAHRLDALLERGLKIRFLDGPIGAASALKMCYGGITKGLIALGSAMLLAATRAGADQALRDELGRSQAQLLAGFAKSVPDMFAKAGRWVPEMSEIAAFLGHDRAEGQMFEAIARFYDRLAADQRADRLEIAMLEDFLRAGPGKP